MKKNTVNNNSVVANVASNNVVIAMTKEEIEMMTKDQIRTALEAVGVELSNTEFKKTRKAELVAMLEEHIDPSKKVEIVSEVVAPVVEEKKSAVTSEKKRIVEALAIAWVYQTVNSVTNDGRVLFYKPTKRVDLAGNYISSEKRLAKVTGDLLCWMYKKKLEGDTWTKWVNRAYEVAVEFGICHRNGNDIHMTDTERARCVAIYNKPEYKGCIKRYADFVTSKK